MTTRPTRFTHRDIQLIPHYEETDDHLVPVPAADVVEAVSILRGALHHYGELDTNFLEGINSA